MTTIINVIENFINFFYELWSTEVFGVQFPYVFGAIGVSALVIAIIVKIIV